MVNRRTVIKGLASVPFLMGATSARRLLNRSSVLVIGAGLSGLNAATLLESQGVDVRVIEGRRRIGGRVHTLSSVPGHPETGGTGASSAYARWIDVARTHDVALTDITPILPYLFKRELVLNDEIIPAKSWPTHPRNPFPQAARTAMPWQFASRVIHGENPLKSLDAWQDPANASLDISIHDWLANHGMTDPMIALSYGINPSLGHSAYDASALMVLGDAALSSLNRQFDESSGVSGYRASKGNQRIPEALAAKLKHEVEFGKEVIGIRVTESGAETHCADGTIFRSDYVVSSMPLPVLRRVRIEPMPTGAQAKLIATLAYQHLTLVHLVAKAPFWNADGLSPNMYTDGIAGMVLAQRRGKSPEEVTSLTAFISGGPAIWLDQMSEPEAKARV